MAGYTITLNLETLSSKIVNGVTTLTVSTFYQEVLCTAGETYRCQKYQKPWPRSPALSWSKLVTLKAFGLELVLVRIFFIFSVKEQIYQYIKTMIVYK